MLCQIEWGGRPDSKAIQGALADVKRSHQGSSKTPLYRIRSSSGKNDFRCGRKSVSRRLHCHAVDTSIAHTSVLQCRLSKHSHSRDFHSLVHEAIAALSKDGVESHRCSCLSMVHYFTEPERRFCSVRRQTFEKMEVDRSCIRNQPSILLSEDCQYQYRYKGHNDPGVESGHQHVQKNSQLQQPQ